MCDFIFFVWWVCGGMVGWSGGVLLLQEFLDESFPVWECLGDGFWDSCIWGIGAACMVVLVVEFCVWECV